MVISWMVRWLELFESAPKNSALRDVVWRGAKSHKEVILKGLSGMARSIIKWTHDVGQQHTFFGPPVDWLKVVAPKESSK